MNRLAESQVEGVNRRETCEILGLVREGQAVLLVVDHPDALTTRHNAAMIAPEQGRAGEELRRVMGVRAKVLGWGDAASPPSKTLFDALRLREKRGDAEALYRAVLERQRAVFREGHPDTVTTGVMLEEPVGEMEAMGKGQGVDKMAAARGGIGSLAG